MNQQKIYGVVAAILVENKKFLGVKRKMTMKSNPGIWEFPGGKIEHHETPTQAVIREVKEELGLNIIAEKEYCKTFIFIHNQKVALHYFVIKSWTGNMVLVDHDQLSWFDVKTYQHSSWLQGDEMCILRLNQDQIIL